MQTRQTLETLSIASTVDHPPLTPPEAQALSQCEQIIRKGLETFVEVGNAFVKIRDQRLFRSSHDTFEEYCRDKWKFTARQANRLIGAGGVVDNLKRDQLVSSVPAAIPENEAQARPLTELPPAKQVEAARIVAAKTNAPTAKDFEEAAEEVVDEKPRITMAGKSSATKTVTRKPSMEALIEVIDEVQTMVKVGKPKEAVLAKLKQAADLATRINNGGSVC
jgi:hypothetical protein